MSAPWSTNNPGIGGLDELTTSEEAIIESIATLGTTGQVLTVDGAGTGVEWTTTGAGDVSKVGTPVDNQIGVWTGDGTIEGDTALTFDTTTDTLTTPNIGGLNTLTFDTTPVVPSYAEGNVYWDETDKTLVIEQGVDDVKLQVGQETYVRARNATGSTITNGSVVYISGQTGNRPNITLAQANAASTSENLGVATHDIENNTDGLVTVSGMVRGIDTSSFLVGDVVYLSASVAGGLTATAPASPNFVVQVARVITSNISTGIIMVITQDFHEGFVSVDDLRVHGSAQIEGLTASEIVITDASKNLVSAAVATYPSLTELTYVKGVTSAIQTQLNAKGTLSNVVEDTTPQLGGNLDVNSQSIVSTSNGNITLTPNGTGNIVLGSFTLDADQSVGAGQDNYVLTYDNGTGLISLEAATGSGTGITWNEVTGTSQSAAVNNGYICNNAALVTVTIPTTAAVGDIVRVAGKGAGGWKIAQNAGETINFGNTATTTGTGGSLASVDQYDAVELVCITANTDWVVISSVGNITIV